MEYDSSYGVPRLQSSNIVICSANKDCGVHRTALKGEGSGLTDSFEGDGIRPMTISIQSRALLGVIHFGRL